MKRALLVDDKPENISLLRALLEGRGWEVVEARHGVEALALARQTPPDIAITDLLMPVMDGYTLLRQWKADPRLKAVPLVVYTATFIDPQDEQLALDLGADAFIPRPTEPDAFLARLEETCVRAEDGELAAAVPAVTEEPVVLREYSETLVRRLEDKSRQLELANQNLRDREARIEHRSRLYATISQVNQAIVRVKTPEELFPAICRVAVEHGRFALAWIGLLDGAANTVTAAAVYGAAAERVAALRLDLNDARFRDGLTSRALATGRLAVDRDIQNNPALGHWRELSQTHGLRAAAVVPFRLQGDIAGFVSLASADVDYFADPERQSLIDEMATDISFALDAMEGEAQRRRAELALVRARAFADAAIQSLPGIFYLFTTEGRFIRWNKNFETVSGYTAEEVARLHPTDLFTGEERELIRQRIGSVFAEGESDAEAHFTSRDGTRTPYYFTGRRVLLDGQPHLVGVGVDLSARRRAEEELRQAREFLEAVLSQSPSGILVASAPEVTIRLANTAALGIRGGDAGRLVGISVAEHAARWQTFRPSGAPYSAEELPLSRAVLRGEATADEEVIIRDESGADHWVSVNAAPIRDTQGRVTHGVVVFHDITERKRAEKGLRDLAHAVNTAGDVVFLTDKEGVITQINEQFTALYGYAAEDVVGKVTPRILKSGKHPPEFYQQVWARLLRAETVHGEISNRSKDGRPVEIEETITPFRDDRGELTGFLAVQREIGARKRAETAVRQQAEDLLARNEELLRFNRATEGRELRMVELKQEINDLCRRAGLPPRYRVDFAEPDAEENP